MGGGDARQREQCGVTAGQSRWRRAGSAHRAPDWGRVFLFLHTDNFWRDYRDFKARGLTFMEEPREEPYGTVAVFRDLYGNLWDLLEPK
jgi:hypothetical protein